MNWLDSVPVVALCALGLVVPGLPIALLLGLRRLAAVAVAPVLVVGVAAVTAIVAPTFGLEWSPLLLLAVVAGLTAVLAGVVRLLGARVPAPAVADGRPVLVAAVAGLGAAMLLGGLTVARAIAGPEQLIETSDSPFHYNAVVQILNSGQASSFLIDTLGSPGQETGGFYPAAWHGLAALLVMITGVSVPVAANVLSVTIALVVWPVGCVLLARQVIGPAPLALGLAGFLSIGFGAFPWEMLGWGVLWPNLLGLSLLPAAMAAVLAALGMAKDDVIGRGRALVLAPVFLVGVGLAHPNAVMSLGAIALPPVAIALARVGVRRYRAGDRRSAALVAAVFVLAPPAYWLVVAKSGLFTGPMGATSPPFESPSHAIGEVFTGGTNGYGAGWVVAGLVLVGGVSALLQRNRRWLVLSHLVACGLYVLAAGVAGDTRRLFTGFWYTDSHRLAAIVPVTGVLLAVLGLLVVIGFVEARVAALGDRLPAALRERRALVLPAVLALLVLATGGLYSTDHRDRVQVAYPEVDPLVDAEEYALFSRLAEHVEEDAVIAAMPLNGSPIAMTLSRRQVLFPQLNGGKITRDQLHVAKHLVHGRPGSLVCRIAKELGVRYLLTNDKPWDTVWDGLTYPGSREGFELLDRGGTFELYRVTACDGPQADPET